jgi:hypothetical protein
MAEMAGEGSAFRSPALEDLAVAVDRFTQRPKAARTPTDLGLELIQIRKLSDRLELEFAEASVAFSASDEYEEWGSANPYDWIRHNCQMNYGPVADRLNVGRRLAELPESVEAMKAGKIGFAHLSVIARTAAALGTTGAKFDEQAVLEQALQHSVGKLWRICQHIRHAADMEGLAEDQRAAVEARRLQLSTRDDGTVMVGGQLDSAGGAALRTALEPLAGKLGPDDDRDYHRRLADALVELATHALDSGALPRKGGMRPHLQVTASLNTLRGLAGSPAGEMAFSLPITSKTVQRLACDSSVVRILLGAESAVIDVGRARRVVSPSIRRALNTRDGQCRWPGCERPPMWTSAHHVVHWAHGGATDLSNLVLLCQGHHWMVHEGGWELILGPNGEITVIPSVARWVPWARGPNPGPAASAPAAVLENTAALV